VLELIYLTSNSDTIAEARYITITGYGINSTFTDHVWASNDPDIASKIDTAELLPGVTRLTDALSPFYGEMSMELNVRAQAEVGDLSKDISALTNELLSLTSRTDSRSVRLRENIQASINGYNLQFNHKLNEISSNIGSYPKFSINSINKSGDGKYIFYKPIMYRQMSDNNFYRGLIRLEVSLDTIISELNRKQMTLVFTVGIVALVVLLIGTSGAFIYSGLITRPIIDLVKHIEMIRDTEDKSQLAGIEINISSKDEIAILGKTINDMTHGLVKAALAASDLSIGKEIQKKFIPLEMDKQGNKQSSGFKNTQNLNFFGYYEGQKAYRETTLITKTLTGVTTQLSNAM